MPLGWDVRHDQFDIVHKSHIKHLVGFIEHDGIDLAELQNSSIDQIDDSSRRADNQVVEVAEITDLHVDIGAADTNNRIEAEAFRENSEFLVNLEGQFAGRGQDKDLLFLVADLFVNQRDEKGGCFSGAGVGKTHDVPVIQNMGDDLVLDWGWPLVAGSCESLENCRIELEVGKLVFRDKMLHFFGDNRGFVDESRKVERGQREPAASS